MGNCRSSLAPSVLIFCWQSKVTKALWIWLFCSWKLPQTSITMIFNYYCILMHSTWHWKYEVGQKATASFFSVREYFVFCHLSDNFVVSHSKKLSFSIKKNSKKRFDILISSELPYTSDNFLWACTVSFFFFLETWWKCSYLTFHFEIECQTYDY